MTKQREDDQEPDRRDHPPTSSRLRKEIDAGRMGDKVAHPDPSAVPLGTHDEVIGHPERPPEAVARAMERKATGERVAESARQRRRVWARPGAWLLMLLVLVALVMVLLAVPAP